jgi:galactose mutarotase-like enzyme
MIASSGMGKATVHSRKTIAGFEVHSLTSGEASVSMVPELGGRIVSLRDRITGREWLDGWAPASKRRIWHPTDPADFATGPGAGIDECLPTVLPCRYGRKKLPDHGELWNTPAGFDENLATKGMLVSRWKLRTLPLAFERCISLRGHQVILDYRLENLADTPTPFLWAWHPLFSWKRGDEIRFARSIKTCLTGDGKRLPWPEHETGCDLTRASFPKGSIPAAKVFIGPMEKCAAEIRAANGARLTLKWPSDLFPYAGIWITRGFWKGLHHWAIEPTNFPADHLSDIRMPSPATQLGAREIRQWNIVVGVKSC